LKRTFTDDIAPIISDSSWAYIKNNVSAEQRWLRPQTYLLV
jgi:hypothetical protein